MMGTLSAVIIADSILLDGFFTKEVTDPFMPDVPSAKEMQEQQTHDRLMREQAEAEGRATAQADKIEGGVSTNTKMTPDTQDVQPVGEVMTPQSTSPMGMTPDTQDGYDFYYGKQ